MGWENNILDHVALRPLYQPALHLIFTFVPLRAQVAEPEDVFSQHHWTQQRHEHQVGCESRILDNAEHKLGWENHILDHIALRPLYQLALHLIFVFVPLPQRRSQQLRSLHHSTLHHVSLSPILRRCGSFMTISLSRGSFLPTRWGVKISF